MTTYNSTRRSFIKFGAAAAALPAFLVLSQKGYAQEMEKLSEDDPMAKALSYKEDTTQVDASAHPNHTNEQVCTGCVLYQGDDPEWGGCGVFPGKLVAGPGWCAAYAPKA